MADKKKKLSGKEDENNIEQSNLDALIFDADEDFNENKSAVDSTNFEAFMAEYRNMIGSTIEKKGEMSAKIDEEPTDDDIFISPPPKKSEKKKQTNKEPVKENTTESNDWDEDITLEPEVYEDLDDKELLEELPEEEHTPDFNLGEALDKNDDKFQLSINFEGDQKSREVEEEDKTSKYNPDKPRIIDWVFDIAEMFVFVLAAVLVLTSFFFKHSVVEGESMMNTLADGDHLIISDVFYTPKRGDIIVFEDYSTALKKAVVKRVIGLPGETVEVKKNKIGIFEVYINGEYLDEEYAYNDIKPNFNGEGVWTVGEGEIFVMGDNRYNSTDSRDYRVGTIDIDSILGKVLFRFLPFEKFGEVD